MRSGRQTETERTRQGAGLRDPLPALSSLPAGQSPTSGPPVLDVRQFLAGSHEARLLHDGQEYRLRITRQGKLILTK
ncbi:MAG: hemin uptake protein HemP [Phycisphaerae bacterium]